MLGASLGVGYTASRPLADSGGALVAKGDTVAYVNAESGRMEAEAAALAPQQHPIEVVTLRDGRVAVVDHARRVVHFLDPGPMQPNGPALEKGDSTRPSGAPDDPRQRGLVVVSGPDSGYLLDIDRGTVELIDLTKPPAVPIQVEGGLTGDAVADGVAGIWVRTRDGRVARITGDHVEVQGIPARIRHLTSSNGRPVGIADSGEVFDLGGTTIRRVTNESVPHGDQVVVGSAKGAGRWVLILDRSSRQLVVLDPGTGNRRGTYALPAGPKREYGAPVQVRDEVYVPDFATHTLHGFNVVTGRQLPEITVPGQSADFSLEVKEGRVWANDQFDRRARVIDRDGRPGLVDKGPGHGVVTDTEAPAEPKPSEQPNPEQPNPERPRSPETPPRQTDPSEPPPTRQPQQPPQAEQVAVPDIALGMPKTEACQRIERVGLACAPVAVGEGGPTDTVTKVDPPAGTLRPKGYRVVVEHYGQVVVPGVTGMVITPACAAVQQKGFTCVPRAAGTPAASLAALGVVTAQTPGAGSKADTRSPVTLDHPDQATVANYAGRKGAEACAEIVRESRNQITCTSVDGPTEQVSGQPVGTVVAQQPAAGGTVRLGQGVAVTLTVVKGSPRVPDIRGKSPDEACLILQQAGPYRCVGQSDALARHKAVVTQETPPDTPLDPGNNVVFHYSPNEPLAVYLYQHDSLPVWAVRLHGASTPVGYHYAGELGYAYSLDTANQVGLGPTVFGYTCGGDDEARCNGYLPNHFYSLRPNWTAPGWTVNPLAQFLAPTSGESCADGQRPLYRNSYGDTPAKRQYKVESRRDPNSVDTEFLGCVWFP